MLEPAATIADLRARFRWDIPARFNIAHACCTRHADAANRPALVVEEPDGRVSTYGFLDLERLSNRLANLWRAGGIGRGDRIGILLGQRVETLLGHLAAHKLGAVSVPLFPLFGPEALEYRLRDSGARLLLTDPVGAAKLEALRPGLPDLRTVWCADGPAEGADALWPALERAGDALDAEDTGPDDPAVIIYTSGTTGQPKGALHGHRVLLGHLPGVQMPQDFFPQPGDRFWTPADWAWIGGLFDVLLPSLYFGVPVVAWRAAKFDPAAACAFMARHGVRNVFMPPTALRFMRRPGVDALARACGCARWPAAASGWATRPVAWVPSGSGSR
jgi:acetyl-CoA synthetase